MSEPSKQSLIGAPQSHQLAGVFPRMPALFADAGDDAQYRLLDFLCSTIRNRNTRQAYAHAIERFCLWCEAHGLQLAQLNSLMIARYIEERCLVVSYGSPSGRPLSDPTIKQHLSAIKMLFDHLVTGHIVPINPAAAVRGPKHVVTKGKTPVLEGPQAKRLLDSIPNNSIAGLRDRALVATMIYSFARISAVLGMDTEDYHPEASGRTMWLRLKEKNGKHHEVPAHHEVVSFLDAYVQAAGQDLAKGTPLFRSIGRYGEITDRRFDRRDAWAMVKRRSRNAGLSSEICCHTFRATGITCYLSSGGTLENAQLIAAHSSPRTTKLYDRTADIVTMDEIERIELG